MNTFASFQVSSLIAIGTIIILILSFLINSTKRWVSRLILKSIIYEYTTGRFFYLSTEIRSFYIYNLFLLDSNSKNEFSILLKDLWEF